MQCHYSLCSLLKHLIFMSRWENSVRKEDTTTISWANFTLRIRKINHPIYTRDKKQASSNQLRSPRGMFIGCALNGECRWTGVAHAEGVKDNTASEVYVKRFKEKEVRIQVLEDNFPCANGSKKTGRSTSSHLQPGSILFDFG